MSTSTIIFCVAGIAVASVLVTFAIVLVVYRRRTRRARELQRAHEEAERRRRKRRRAGLRSAEINAAAPEKLVVAPGHTSAYCTALTCRPAALSQPHPFTETNSCVHPSVSANATNSNFPDSDGVVPTHPDEAGTLSVSTENDLPISSHQATTVTTPGTPQKQQQLQQRPQNYSSPVIVDDVEAELHASGHSGQIDDRFSEVELSIDAGRSPSSIHSPDGVHADGSVVVVVVDVDSDHKSSYNRRQLQSSDKDRLHINDDHSPSFNGQLTGKSDRTEPSEPPTPTELAEGEDTCAVCLDELVVGNRVRRLPCDHVFHSDCIRTWLRRKNACPCCCTPVIKRRKKKRKKTEDPASGSTGRENNLSQVVVDSVDNRSVIRDGSSIAASCHAASHPDSAHSQYAFSSLDAASTSSATRHARPAQVQVHQMSSPALTGMLSSSTSLQPPSSPLPPPLAAQPSDRRHSRLCSERREEFPMRRLDDRTESDTGMESNPFGSFTFDRKRVPRSMSSRGFNPAVSGSGSMTIGRAFPRNGSLLDPDDPTSGYLTSEASSHFDEPIEVLLDHVRRVLRGEASIASFDGYSTDGDVPDPSSVPDAEFDDEQSNLHCSRTSNAYQRTKRLVASPAQDADQSLQGGHPGSMQRQTPALPV